MMKIRLENISPPRKKERKKEKKRRIKTPP